MYFIPAPLAIFTHSLGLYSIGLKNEGNFSESDQEEMDKLLEIQEKEKNYFILEQMDWDKNFVADSLDNQDDSGGLRNEALMSEFEQK